MDGESRMSDVVGAGGHGQMAPRHVSIRRDGALAVTGAHVAVNVQEPHEVSALIDAQTRKLRPQLLGPMLRAEAGEPALSP